MSFGPASLGTSASGLPSSTPTSSQLAGRGQFSAPERGTIYDCGKHGWLTVKQIARIAGTSKTAIYKRLNEGARGDALCVRRWANQSKIRRDAPPRRHSLVMALKIAMLYPDRLPQVSEIQQLRPMSDKNAQTWRQAIATARKAAGL